MVFDQSRLREHSEARLIGFGDEYFNRMIADCLGPDFGGDVALRRVPRRDDNGPSWGYQFCFLVQKRDGVGEPPVDFDLWCFVLEESLRPDPVAADRLLREWSAHPRGGVPIANPLGPTEEAVRTAQDQADEKLSTLCRDHPEPLHEVRLLSCAVVQFA